MNLEAEIARVQLNSLPASIVKRLLKRSDVAALVEAGSAEVSEIGQFYFADIRSTLAEAEFDVYTDLPARQGVHRISIARSADGRCRVRGKSDVETTLPELSLLDPSAQVRLNGARLLAERALPCWPRSASWENVVADRPLCDREFGLVLDELQGVADPVLDRIAAVFGGGQFKALDVVPTGKTYYESLLGQMPAATGASQYVEDNLYPHFQGVFEKDASWGLRCVHAACISELVDPDRVAGEVSNDLLYSAIQTVGCGVTPFAILATYKLASLRALSDERFSSAAEEALAAIIQRTSLVDAEPGVDALFLALVRLTLSVIGQAEELVSAPPFWKRLAAFTHAAFLVETIDFSGSDVNGLVKWCDSRRTPETGAVEILDQLREPAWRADAQSAGDLWSAALIRAIRWTPSGAGPTLGLTVDQLAQVQQLHPKLLLAAGVPDPMCGVRRDRTALGVQVMDEDLLSGFDPDAAAGVPPTPSQTWIALAHSSRIYAFSDGLLVRVRDLAKKVRIGVSPEVGDVYSLLVWCCDVASTQADLDLAEIAVACVIDASERLTDPSDAVKCAAVVVLASGAAHDRTASLQWAADRLLALAYRLPRGACCERFAQSVSTIQNFIPLGERRWGKAIVTARSAIA